MHPSVSVVTIVKGRVRQLTNLVSSLEQAVPKPAELIVVWMAPPCSESLLTSPCFPIRHKFVAHDALPLPKARNKGFQACENEHVVYMDVDCLCPDYFFSHVIEVMHPGRVITSRILYLPTLPETVDYPVLLEEALPCPSDPQSFWQDDPHFDAFNTFWFAMLQSDFTQVGGFDEQYEGFGVSDVDFAARCQAADMTLYTLPDKVLHQFHPRVDPPINHLSDIVNNARLYYERWGQYPLQDWLHEFAREGLINHNFASEGLKVRRLPSGDEIQAHMTRRPY